MSFQEVSITKVQIPNCGIEPHQIPQLRGAMGTVFRQYDELHNHIDANQYIYRTPSVQYKSIHRVPTIIGYANGAQVLKNVWAQLNTLTINGRSVQIENPSIQEYSHSFGRIDSLKTYQFLHPWMALNPENYAQYQNIPEPARNAFLAKILKGNLMSLSKGFDYQIPDVDSLEIYVRAIPKIQKFKGSKMLCFLGSFAVNFDIPNHIGIGKQSARGFGTIQEVRQ